MESASGERSLSVFQSFPLFASVLIGSVRILFASLLFLFLFGSFQAAEMRRSDHDREVNRVSTSLFVLHVLLLASFCFGLVFFGSFRLLRSMVMLLNRIVLRK